MVVTVSPPSTWYSENRMTTGGLGVRIIIRVGKLASLQAFIAQSRNDEAQYVELVQINNVTNVLVLKSYETFAITTKKNQNYFKSINLSMCFTNLLFYLVFVMIKLSYIYFNRKTVMSKKICDPDH